MVKVIACFEDIRFSGFKQFTICKPFLSLKTTFSFLKNYIHIFLLFLDFQAVKCERAKNESIMLLCAVQYTLCLYF